MSFISSASGDSQLRGYKYWEEKKVTSYQCVSEGAYVIIKDFDALLFS